MGLPHPLLHIGKPPLCSNDTRSGERSAVFSLPSPAVSVKMHSLTFFVGDFLLIGDHWGMADRRAFVLTSKEAFIMKKTRFPVRRIALNAVMVALYIGLSLFSIPLGGLKITVEALPVIICAIAFGPVDAAIVGFLSEFLNQMLTYGFTPTTLLWVLPSVVRGLFVGLCVLGLTRNTGLDGLLRSRRSIVLLVVCVISGILVSCINTFTLYVDSKMYGYYSYAMVFGVFWVRIITGMISSAAMGAVTMPIVLALKRAKIIQ